MTVECSAHDCGTLIYRAKRAASSPGGSVRMCILFVVLPGHANLTVSIEMVRDTADRAGRPESLYQGSTQQGAEATEIAGFFSAWRCVW